MHRPLLPPRGIFVPTMMVYIREIPLRGPHQDTAAWVDLAEELDRDDRIYGAPAGLPLLKSSIAVIVFMAPPPLAAAWPSSSKSSSMKTTKTSFLSYILS